MATQAPNNPNIPPPSSPNGLHSYLVQATQRISDFLYRLAQRANATLPEDGSERMTGPLPFEEVATASLPPAANWTGSVVWDSTVGVLKYSDGANWLIIGSGSSSPTVVSYFGSGDPSTLHNEGDLYFDTSTTPYTPWVQHSSAWHQDGVVEASAGTYGDTSNYPVITVDSHHRITSITTQSAVDTTTHPLSWPQGRLTLQSFFGVQNTDQIGVSSIYYGPFAGQRVPVYNGSTFANLILPTQISMGLDAVTPHVANANLYDIFAINNSGSIALCIGPAWAYASTITVTIATPAVVSWTGHGLPEGAPIRPTTTGALPTGITAGTVYYVAKSPGANSFNISTSIANASAGTLVATSGTQSGTHTATNGTGGNGSDVNTARGTGAGTTELDLSLGLWTNKNILTHAWGGASGTTDYGPVAANQATYLGTLFATANGQTTLSLKPASGTSPIIGLYNLYNRVRVYARCLDGGSQFGRTTNAWVPFNPGETGSGTNNRVSFVDGFQTSNIEASASALYFTTANAAQSDIGITANSTTATPSFIDAGQTNAVANTAGMVHPKEVFYPLLGYNYVQLMCSNQGNTGTASFNPGVLYASVEI